MYMQFTYQTNGPSSIPTRSHMNNGVSYVKMGMPFKSQNMAQGSLLSNARAIFINDAGGGQNWYSSSDIIALKRNNAIGKSSTQTGLPENTPHSFKNSPWSSTTNINTSKQAVKRCRSGGSVAPKKKGAIVNTYKGSGCC